MGIPSLLSLSRWVMFTIPQAASFYTYLNPQGYFVFSIHEALVFLFAPFFGEERKSPLMTCLGSDGEPLPGEVSFSGSFLFFTRCCIIDY